jgi:hypothetical protein
MLIRYSADVVGKNIERAKLRGCYCGLWDSDPKHCRDHGFPEGFCGHCDVCGKPGHLRQHPAPIGYTGAWCDEHYAEEEKRADDEVMNWRPPNNPPMQRTGAARIVAVIRKLLGRGSGR